MKKVDTLIASDIHLGSGVSRSDVLIETLKEYEYKKLILLGDIFDDLNFSRFKNKDWDFLSYIRNLSNQNTGVEVIWIAGNHDELLTTVMSYLLGIPVLSEYQWEYQGEKYLAIHGHQFDNFMINNKIISEVASIFYKFLQKIDLKKHRFSRFIKRMSKSWLRISEEIADKALHYGKEKGVQKIFCGHTHQSLFRKKEDIEYYNTGCWTDIPSTYIVINEQGICIKEIK